MNSVRGAMVRRCGGASDGARVRSARTVALSHVRTHRRTVAPSHHRTSRSQLSGFTLIELMIVMSLIVILAGIGLAVHANSQTRAKEAVLKEDLFRMRDAIDQYYADKNMYPASLEELVGQKYLRALPVDPFTNSSSTWRTVMSEIDAANPSAQPGVFDVKSGSERIAIDGTNYADW
jgi:general secretion pathway protein G